MSEQDDIFPGESAGLEESSQGAFNPADDVSERPQIPLEGGLNLSVSVKSQDKGVLEVEHLFGQSPIFQGLLKEEIREVINHAVKLRHQAIVNGDMRNAAFEILVIGAVVEFTRTKGEPFVIIVADVHVQPGHRMVQRLACTSA